MNLNRLVVLRGAAFALLLASPAALANTWLQGQDPEPAGLLNLTLLIRVIGFFVGGLLAGSEADEQRAKHGAAAGVVAFVPVQLIGLLSPNSEGPRLFSIIFLGFMAAVAGTLGALVAARRQAGRLR